MVGERWNLKQCYKRLRSKNVQWLVFLHGGPNYTITLYRSVLPTLNFPQSLLYNLGVHNISWLTAMQPSLELITLQLLSAQCSPKCVCTFWRCWVGHTRHQLRQYLRHTFWIRPQLTILLPLMLLLLCLLLLFSSTLPSFHGGQYCFSARWCCWAARVSVVGEAVIWISKASINAKFFWLPSIHSIELLLKT